MARLILTHEGAVIREYQLNKDRTSVGRKPHNDIHLEDPTVSGEHAIFLKLQHYYVEDMGSTNGVVLNGKRVAKRQLTTGDIIRIGRHEFKFVDAANEFDQTVLISPIRPTATKEVAPKKGMVKVLNGPKSGEQIILNKPYTTLGSPGIQVAVIAKRGINFFLMPMSGVGDASGPPQLNGQPIGAQSKPLKSGDVIEVAGTKLQFNESV